jgi:DNA-binding SARP family transcriptional activator
MLFRGEGSWDFRGASIGKRAGLSGFQYLLKYGLFLGVFWGYGGGFTAADLYTIRDPCISVAWVGALTLRTLGTIGLYADEDASPILGPGKPLALLIYLAVTPGRRVSRDFLLHLLWSDLDPERARRALRQALFHLRRLLGEHVLPGNEELLLMAELTTDRDAFLAAIERGELESAFDAYRGEFLPSFGVPGGVDFEQWADLERDRLCAAYLRCAELVVRRHLNHSRFREAQRCARAVRTHAPGAEAGWRLLLEVVCASNDFVSAAVEAGAVEQWAAAEGVKLEAATRSLIARARQVVPASGSSPDSTLVAELVGREREFAAITSACDTALSGHPCHIHITGAAGLGKTRLLRDVLARLRAAGTLVVEVRGAPGDRSIPYAFAADFALALASLPGARGVASAAAATLSALNPAVSSHLSAVADNVSGAEHPRR